MMGGVVSLAGLALFRLQFGFCSAVLYATCFRGSFPLPLFKLRGGVYFWSVPACWLCAGSLLVLVMGKHTKRHVSVSSSSSLAESGDSAPAVKQARLDDPRLKRLILETVRSEVLQEVCWGRSAGGVGLYSDISSSDSSDATSLGQWI